MNKEELEKYENVIDKMYQEKMHSRDVKTDKGTIIDLGIDVKFTELEEASIIILREEIRQKEIISKLQKENEYLREREEYLEKRRSDIINTFQNKVTVTTIPKDKIKDKIKELKEQLEHTNTMEWQEIIKKQIEILEDLLKE